VENEDVYGEGVNIAERLQSIADPGGIYISESIEKAIHGQTSLQTRYLGEIPLKNVGYRVRTYAIQGEWLPVPDLKNQKDLTGTFNAGLYRRGVLRAGIIYIILSLLLILLLPYVKSFVDLPSWSTTVLYIFLVIGFPVAMFLAWNYELSPQGFVRISSEESWRNPYKISKRKPLTGNYILYGLLIVVIAVYATSLIKPHERKPDSTVKLNSAERNNSIAVLPFDDFSPAGNQEWLSDGLMDAINSNLINIDGLRVIARTTMMRFKNSSLSPHEIAEDLKVTHLLQGSVLRYEDKIRVNVQLINGEDNTQQWTKTFDQSMSKIYDILDEVAINVGRELKFQFDPDEIGINPAERTDNVKAYELYLQARYIVENTWGAQPATVKELLEEVIDLDSSFIAPYVWLGYYWMSLYSWSGVLNMNFEHDIQTAREKLAYAISMAPDYGDPHIYMGTIDLFYNQEIIKGKDMMLKGFRLNPSSYNKQFLANTILPATGDFDFAYKMSLEAMDESPYFVGSWSCKGLNEYLIGEYDKARETFKRGRNIFTEGNLDNTAARVYYALGEYEKVVNILKGYLNRNPDLRPARSLGYLAMAYYKLGNNDKFQALVDELKKQAEVSPIGSPSFSMSMICAQSGDFDAAFEWLEKSYRDHEVEMYWLKVEPPFEPIRTDPRYQVMLDKVGFPD
jgi:TolB-like protein/Tfp pilus assembly protein PilF